MKLDLDDLESKARAAEQDEWRWRAANGDVLEGAHNGQLVLGAEDVICSVSDRAHIEANSPPVTLALIARIRRLEHAMTAVVLAHRELGVGPVTADLLAKLLEEGAVLP